MKNKSLNSIEKAISYPVRNKLSKGGKPEEENQNQNHSLM